MAVHASETVAVVAAPGVGGSTLLLVAAGIARPDWGGGSVRHVKVGRGAMAVHLVPTEPALPGSATPRELLLQRAWRTGCGNRPAMEAERQLRHRILASVANVPLRRLPPYFAWLTALAAARMEPGVVLVDRPPDDARTRGLAVEPALAVAERGRVELRAELHLVREPSSAPPGARVVQLRDGRVVGQGTGW